MHIDWWTLALQTVNVLILIWLLARFFFRPVAAMVAQRQAQTEKALADAAAARQQALALQAEADKTRAELASQRDGLLGQAHQEAEAEKASLLARAGEEVAHQRDAAQAAIARERQAAQDALARQAGQLSLDIARRLLQRLPPEIGFAAFLAGLEQALRELAPELRSDLAAADAAHPLDVASAAPLSAAQQAQLRQMLREALGVEPPLVLRSDPSLIAGIEIHGRTTVLRNNWQADLASIGEELQRERNRHAT